MSSQDLFNQLDPMVRQAVITAGGGFRSISEGELFFPSAQLAEEWVTAQGYQGGYSIGILVIMYLPDGQRIGLTTIADDLKQAHRQALAYMKAHSKCEASHGTMWEVWEIRFSYN